MFRQASKRFSTAAGAAQNLTNRLNGILFYILGGSHLVVISGSRELEELLSSCCKTVRELHGLPALLGGHILRVW